jgi:hypothetical protein
MQDNRFSFIKEAEGALVPVLFEKYGQEMGAAAGVAARPARTSAAKREFGPTLLEK